MYVYNGYEWVNPWEGVKQINWILITDTISSLYVLRFEEKNHVQLPLFHEGCFDRPWHLSILFDLGMHRPRTSCSLALFCCLLASPTSAGARCKTFQWGFLAFPTAGSAWGLTLSQQGGNSDLTVCNRTRGQEQIFTEALISLNFECRQIVRHQGATKLFWVNRWITD